MKGEREERGEREGRDKARERATRESDERERRERATRESDERERRERATRESDEIGRRERERELDIYIQSFTHSHAVALRPHSSRRCVETTVTSRRRGRAICCVVAGLEVEAFRRRRIKAGLIHPSWGLFNTQRPHTDSIIT